MATSTPAPLIEAPVQFIRFDNDMFKLPEGANGQLAILQDVLVLDLSEQTPAFLEYDTRMRPGSENYRLSSGLYLCLIFTIQKNQARGAGTIFTTLRKFDVNKQMHYRSLIGERFKIAIGESAHVLPPKFQ